LIGLVACGGSDDIHPAGSQSSSSSSAGGAGGSGGTTSAGGSGGTPVDDPFAWEVTKGSCTLLYEIAGEAENEYLGGTALGGDVDGDGTRDLFVASAFAIQVRSGKDGALVEQRALEADEWVGLTELDHDVGTDGAPDIGALRSRCETLGEGGGAVSSGDCVYDAEVLASDTADVVATMDHAIQIATVADRDANGKPDYAITTDDAYVSSGDPTTVEIHSSATLAVLSVIAPPAQESPWSYGTALRDAGDVNDDGKADLVMTITDLVGTLTGIHMHSGANDALIWSDDLAVASVPWGDRVIRLGDVDDDGAGDLLVNDHNAPAHGTVHAVSGRDGTVLWSDAFLYDNQLDELGASGLHYGLALAQGGDLDRDGKSDMLAGGSKPGFPIFFNGEGGAFRVLSAVDGSVLVEVQEVVDSEALEQDGFRFAASLSRLPDINGDDLDEIVVSAPRAPHGATKAAGRVLVLSCTP
jgi:hypothetical protein